jgi:hypothetical protein
LVPFRHRPCLAAVLRRPSRASKPPRVRAESPAAIVGTRLLPVSAGGVVRGGVPGLVVPTLVVVSGGVLVAVVRDDVVEPPWVVGTDRRGTPGTLVSAPVVFAPVVLAPVVLVPIPVPVAGVLLPALFDPLVEDPDGVVQVGLVMVLSSSVTAPVRASNRPEIVAPVFAVTEASAMTLPTNVELVPSVAELPTCQ